MHAPYKTSLLLFYYYLSYKTSLLLFYYYLSYKTSLLLFYYYLSYKTSLLLFYYCLSYKTSLLLFYYYWIRFFIFHCNVWCCSQVIKQPYFIVKEIYRKGVKQKSFVCHLFVFRLVEQNVWLLLLDLSFCFYSNSLELFVCSLFSTLLLLLFTNVTKQQQQNHLCLRIFGFYFL